MKKVLFITAFFALAACSEDVYQEIDQQNEDMMAPPTFNDGDPGYFDALGDPNNRSGAGYASPWDIWYRIKAQPGYIIKNGYEIGSNYTMTVTPWVGLAYFDGTDDGLYTDPSQGGAVIADFTTGNYPNLYASGHEVGNLVPAEPLKMDGTTLDQSEVAIDSDINHLPVYPGNLGPGWNPRGLYFKLNTVNNLERVILSQYGKVFFYEVEITETATGISYGSYILQLENKTLDQGIAEWVPVSDLSSSQVEGNMQGNLIPLYYYYANLGGTNWQHHPISNPDPTGNGGSWCDSREVVFRNDYEFKQSVLDQFGNTVGTLSLTIGQGDQLWLNASMILEFIP